MHRSTELRYRKDCTELKKLLIVDGNSILNRAFFGVRPLTASDGLPVNALYGMLNILQKQAELIKPDYAAVAFDVSKHTFRHDRYEQYKAGRKGMPEELAAQLPYAHELVRALGFHTVTKQDYEADDLLGTYSRMAEEAGMEAYVFTGDRDSLQLISENVTVILATNKENVRFDREHFTDTYGIPPSRFVYVKALMGDASDNIPGVAGIGEKTALKLISQFGSLDALYEDVSRAEVGASAKAKLEAGRESAYLSLWLATIDRAVPVDVPLEELAYSGWRRGELYRLLTRFEFVNHLKKYGLTSNDAADPADNAENTATAEPSEAPTVTVTTVSSLEAIPPQSEPLMLFTSPAEDEGEAVLCLCGTDTVYRATYPSRVELLAALSQLTEPIAVCDSKSLYNEMARQFPEKTPNLSTKDDLSLAAYTADTSSRTYAADELCQIYLGETLSDTPELAAYQLARTLSAVRSRLERSGQSSLYESIELPLARVLSEMETVGFKVDTRKLSDFGTALDTLATEYAGRIYMQAGHEFNINSPKQLGQVLFEELKLPHGKKTQSGYSTSADVLEKLRAEHVIVSDILEYRSVTKLRATYADGLCRAANEDERVHTSLNQTMTVTGRLSSAEPNLQNIPVRTELGRELRKFFIPSDSDHVLIDADYSQIELRLLAHIAGDTRMIEGFTGGEDVHSLTASQVFGVPLEAVTPELRKRAKAVNFGIVYGMGDFSLAADIGVSRKEAAEYIKSYFEKYPQISSYLSDVVEKAKQNGYTETVFGRRRYIPELTSPKAMLRAFGERAAMNSPIQGSSADIIKLAMIGVRDRLLRERLDARLILQVHDELIVEASRADAPRAAEILKDTMENVVKLSVPLTVSLSMGDTWADCK